MSRYIDKYTRKKQNKGEKEMPIIQTYANNDIYTGFLLLDDATKKKLKDEFLSEVKRTIGLNGDEE